MCNDHGHLQGIIPHMRLVFPIEILDLPLSNLILVARGGTQGSRGSSKNTKGES